MKMDKGVSSALVLALLGSALFAPVIAVPTSPDGPWWWPTQGFWFENQVLIPEDVPDPSFPLTFGADVDIDGDTLLVGTQLGISKDHWLSCPSAGFDDGCDWVYVYNRDESGQWTLTTKLVPGDARPGDTFGYSAAIDEKSGVIVVGNPGKKTRADTIYIFERSEEGEWGETARFKKTYPGLPEDQLSVFGVSVDVSGHTVVATDIVGPTTHVYEKVDGTWVQTSEMEGGTGPEGVAIAGDTVVVKVFSWTEFECIPGIWARGIYQTYHREDGKWISGDSFDPQAEHGNKTNTMGGRHALSEDGHTLIISASADRRMYGVHTEYCLEVPYPLEGASVYTKNGVAGAVGSVWIYEYQDGRWVQTADIPNPMPNPGLVTDGSVFGASVDISGDRVVIGADGDMYDTGGIHSGAAYVYEKVADQWIFQGKLRNHDTEDDWFGYSVGISGETVVAGAPFNTKSGKAYVFQFWIDGHGFTKADFS